MILFITRKYPPSVGGMQNLSYRITTEVSKRAAARIISWGGSQRWLPVFSMWAFLRAVVALVQDNVTLIHLSDPVLAPLGIILRALGRVPVAINAHGLDITYPHPLYQAIIPACLRHLDRIICISRYTMQECVRRGIPVDRCVVIPLGIDVGDFVTTLSADERSAWLSSRMVSPPEQHVLLTVGRLVPRKGLVPFVSEALPLLLAQRQDWVYLIVGEGPEHAAIADAVESRGLSDHVRLLGHLDDTALRTAYALADLFVMPNVPVPGNPEGFGLVVLEARAAGVPVVAADLDGISEAFNEDQDGTLIQAGDWPAFVSSIGFWLDRRETARDREWRRQRTEARFAWSRIVSQYLEAFQEVESEHYAQREGQIAHRD